MDAEGTRRFGSSSYLPPLTQTLSPQDLLPAATSERRQSQTGTIVDYVDDGQPDRAKADSVDTLPKLDWTSADYSSLNQNLKVFRSDVPGRYLQAGQLFTWGHSSSGQLGQELFEHPVHAKCCAIPYPVPELHNVAHVSCGGLDEGFTVISTATGEVYTFGKDLFGRLGHGNYGRAVRTSWQPRLVDTLKEKQCRAVRVAAGTEHAMCLSEKGGVWSWGRNLGGCLGRGTVELPSNKPIAVSCSCDISVTCNHAHATDDPRLMESIPGPVLDLGHGRSSWISTHFGRRVASAENSSRTSAVLFNVVEIDCEYHYSAALLGDGRLVLWGINSHGQLGIGDKKCRALPQQAKGLLQVKSFSLGSRYAAAVTTHGALFCWGEGIHGNLGLGDRMDRIVPTRVTGNDLGVLKVIHVSCSRGQGWHLTQQPSKHPEATGRAKQHRGSSKFRGSSKNERRRKQFGGTKASKVGKGGKRSQKCKRQRHIMDKRIVYHQPAKSRTCKVKSTNSFSTSKAENTMKTAKREYSSGDEGAHTIAITSDGSMYTFGTAHNGVLANLGEKTSALCQGVDELVPYLVGSSWRSLPHRQQQIGINMEPVPQPMSPYASWPNYATCGPFVSCCSSHDHCVALNNRGELWAWGNGADGRAGVERYLNRSGEAKNGKTGKEKPPGVDWNKCFLMGPHRVGVARESYWPGGDSLRYMRVQMVSAGRNHMACIALPSGNQHDKAPVFKTTVRGTWKPPSSIGVGHREPFTRPCRVDWSP